MTVRTAAVWIALALLAPWARARPPFQNTTTKHFSILIEAPATEAQAKWLAERLEQGWADLPGGKRSALAGAMGNWKVQVSMRRYSRHQVLSDSKFFDREWTAKGLQAKAEANLIVGLTGKHFRAVFFPAWSAPEFALIALDDLERAWREVVDSLGYRKPSSRWKIDCYITPVSELSPASVAGLHTGKDRAHRAVIYTDPPAGYARYVPRRLIPEDIRSTLLHEFFHIVQSEYFPKDKLVPKWLTEGSARWIEAEVYEPDKQDWILDRIGSRRSRKNLVPWWWFVRGGLMELGHWYEQTGNSWGGYCLPATSYASALFLQQVVQQKGAAVVRRMWEAIAKGKVKGFEAGFDAIGGRAETRRLYGEFAAGLVVRTRDRSQYGWLPLTGVMTPQVRAKLDGSGRHRPIYPKRVRIGLGPSVFPLQAAAAKLEPIERRGNEMGVQLLELSPEAPLARDPDGAPSLVSGGLAPDLLVAVRGAGSKDDDFAFLMVSIPAAFGSRWPVQPLAPATGGGYRVSRVRNYGEECTGVVLAAAHVPAKPPSAGYSGSVGTYRIATLLTPPFVRSVDLVLPRGDRWLWSFRRTRAGGRWREVLGRDRRLDAGRKELQEAGLNVIVDMSRTMRSVRIGLGREGEKGFVRTIDLTPDKDRMTWFARGVSCAGLFRASGNRFVLGVRGFDMNGIRLDPVPATPVDLRPDLRVVGWEEIADSSGGYERFRLRVEGRAAHATWNVRCINHKGRWTVDIAEFPDGTVWIRDEDLLLKGKTAGVSVDATCPLETCAQFASQRVDSGRRVGNPSAAVLAAAGIRMEYRLTRKPGNDNVLEGLLVYNWYWASDHKFVRDVCSIVAERAPPR